MSNQIIHSTLNVELAEIILRDVLAALKPHDAGHCIQITDLPDDLLEAVCQNLQSSQSDCEAYVLRNNPSQAWHITSTKLVERRNLTSKKLVVFLPPGIRTSAEDSFDISTFERFLLGDVYERLQKDLKGRLRVELQKTVEQILRATDSTAEQKCRYLLAVAKSNDPEQAIGASLYHLGLVPDPALLSDPSTLLPRLSRNQKAVQALAAPDESLFAKIQSLGLEEGKTSRALFRFFSDTESFEPARWLPTLADELTFDHWDFREKISGDVEEIAFTGLGMSRRNEEGYLLFDAQHDRQFRVTWETNPPPFQCKSLASFTIEMMQDNIPVTEPRTVKAGTSSSKGRSTTFKDLGKFDLADGLYYLRVSAWAPGGVLLKNAESETFFMKGITEQDEDEDGTSDERGKQTTVRSLYEAMLRTQVSLQKRKKAIDLKKMEVNWITPERRVGRRYNDQFAISLNASQQFVLPINAILRHLEAEALSDADSLGRYELDLSKPFSADIQPTLQAFAGIDIEALREFLLIRKDVFQQILNQDLNREIQFLVETSDLSQWTDQIIGYAQSYLNVLSVLRTRVATVHDIAERKKLIAANRQVLGIDCVRLKLPEGQEVYLMGPTHPLKMLWALQYSRLTHHWLEEIESASEEVSWSVFDQFLSRLISLNLPHAMVDSAGQILINAENFSPFWSIFAPLSIKDVRTLVGRVKGLLGSPESDQSFTTVTGSDLTRQVLRYVAQHPYVTTLCINAVQPGSGGILVEMLLELEESRPDLRYQLHLFSGDFHFEELGNALDELMSPSEKRSGRDVLDSFVTESKNALMPKLVYSKHRLGDLLDQPAGFEAHITMLFDAFGVEVQTTAPIAHARSNFFYGLLNEYVEQFTSADGNIAWERQVIHQSGIDVDDDKSGHNVLAQLCHHYGYLAASIATDGEHLDRVPTVCLPLGATDKNLISQVHQVSDWVFTVDRNFGLEYLDSPFDKHCPAYLIDYQPEYLGEIGHRLIVSTQQLTEIERIVRPILQELGIPGNQNQVVILVDALRSVSGRLVLKLLSSPQMARGAMGMGLARLFLEQAELLRDMLLIPLDTHADLFSTARQETERLGQTLSLRRTDMLLVELEPKDCSITFHLIEVKFRSNAGSGGLVAQSDLKREIADQLENSFQVLSRLYDPEYHSPDRFDRLIRTQELTTLLKFYLERASRYQLLSPRHFEPIQQMLDQLEQGYTLRFSRSGVILNLQDQGYQTEKEGEVIYHYLGTDQIKSLVDAARVARETHQTIVPDPTYATTRSSFTKRLPEQDLFAPKEEEILEPEPELVPIVPPPQEEQVIQEPAPIQLAELPTGPACEIILGAKHPTPQYGILGKSAGQNVGLDLNGVNAISLFGVQGSGKSYTLGTILEMAVMPIPGINQLPRPLAAVVFHYSKTQEYVPEFVSMNQPNESQESAELAKLYGAHPSGLSDVIVLTPETKLEQRRNEYPNLSVYPITFDASELAIGDWKFLMGVVGSEAMYVKRMNQLLKRLKNPTLAGMYEAVAGARLSDAQVELARSRLEFAKEYVRDGQLLAQHIRPGRLIVVDLRDETIEKDEALGLFMVMLNVFANARHHGQPFNKLIVFDEAHKYISSELIEDVVGVVREMRHKGTSVLVASQDPKSVPLPLIELSSQIILHKFSSPDWLKHIQKGITALKDLTAGQLNMLDKGQALVWSRDATHSQFESRAVRVEIRPRVTKHGGGTITAVGS